jgi:phosphoglycerate dehydrogenase-like enzyme
MFATGRKRYQASGYLLHLVTTPRRIAIAPQPAAGWIEQAVVDGGGQVTAVEEAEGLVWTSPRGADDLVALLAQAPGVEWVQLPWAGVEDFAAAGMFAPAASRHEPSPGDRFVTESGGVGYPERRWTCGKGVYAEPVAEHALALGLAGLRDFPDRVRATSWGRSSGRSLYDAPVTIVGGGGITEALLDLLRPYRADVTVVRRSLEPMAGAARTVTVEHLHEALATADLVVLALALTPGTERIIDATALARMQPHAWLVNVARGRHVDTDALVDALRRNRIGGAGLDVTDPEPLPDGHPLWSLPNVIITPHTANTPEMAMPLLAARITENVRRFANDEPLVGSVDPTLGY